MNINKFLVKAKEAGIDVSEIKISRITSSSVSIFRGEIDSNEFSSTSSLTARGIYKGKLGAVSSENLNDSSIDSLIKDIIARVIANNEESVNDYKSGHDRALKYLMGQVMKESKGQVNPSLANKLLQEELTK